MRDSDYIPKGFDNATGKLKPIRRRTPKIGRNKRCPCGSNLKFKHCHGKGVRA